MKYKIKVEVMQDGSNRYYPMVKRHWYSRWENINSFHPYLSTMQIAEKEIEAFRQKHLRKTVDYTYEVPYTFEEIQNKNGKDY